MQCQYSVQAETCTALQMWWQECVPLSVIGTYPLPFIIFPIPFNNNNMLYIYLNIPRASAYKCVGKFLFIMHVKRTLDL